MTDNTINNDVTIRGGGASALGRIDQYELVRELGTGGFGKVYLARDTTSDIDVALKVIGNDRKSVCCSFGWNGTTMQGAAGGANGLENELRENFKLIHGLTHPNIAVSYPLHLVRDVRASGVSIGRGDVLSVMAFASGVTLDKWRKMFADGRVPVRLVADIVTQIASALDYAHANGVIHRDVKPSNVMVDTSKGCKPFVRLLDFGLAAADGGQGICGTPRYMSPEQWRGDRQDKGTDQYALGVLACELLTGHVPFESVFDCDDREVMKVAVVNRELELPRELSDRQRKVVAKAMAKVPEDRFASCAAFADALEGASSDVFGRKLLIAGAILVALALAGIGGWWISRPQRDVAPQPSEQPRPSAEPSEPLPAKPSPLPVKPPAPPAERPRPSAKPQPSLVEEPARPPIVADAALQVVEIERFPLSKMYASGEQAYGTDYGKEFQRLSRKAMKGDADAQFCVGWMYRNGLGVGANDAQARKYFKKSADGGNPYAVNLLTEFGEQR